MSLRFVILGLLAEQPLHGYAIQASLETRYDDLCEPSFGDVYRTLAALSRDGLVTVAVDRIGRRPRRKVHAPRLKLPVAVLPTKLYWNCLGHTHNRHEQVWRP